MGKTLEIASIDIIDKSTQSQPWSSDVPRKVLGVTPTTGGSEEEEAIGWFQIWERYNGIWPLLQRCHRCRRWQEKNAVRRQRGCSSIDRSKLAQETGKVEKICASLRAQGWGLEERHPSSLL